LDVVLEREGREIPWVVDKLLDDIERRGQLRRSYLLMVGLDEVGLYRVPGSVSSVKALTAALDAGEDVDMDDSRWIDVNVVAGTFKSWLRELPDSILTPALYDKFILAVGLQDYEEKFYAIKGLVHQLPKANFALLKRVIYHFKRCIPSDTSC
jgi:GTPase-activating protein BEM2